MLGAPQTNSLVGCVVLLQALIHRLRALLDQGGWDAETPAGQELKTIVTLRVRH